MVRTACILLALCCTAQRVPAQMTAQQFESMVEWQNATKLSLDPVPANLAQPGGGTDFEKMQKGDFGNFAFWAFKVLQIIDNENMLLVLGSGKLIWLKGYPTDALADGQKVRLVGICQMIGTESYANASGSTSTVRVFKMLSDRQAKELQEELAQQAREQAEQERIAQMETFTAKTGHTVEARFLGNRGALIYLETREGRKITVPLSKFADESADRIRELIAESKK